MIQEINHSVNCSLINSQLLKHGGSIHHSVLCLQGIHRCQRLSCTHLLGNEECDSPETTFNEDIFLHRNRRCPQSQELKHLHQGSKQNLNCSILGCTAWRGGSALGYSVLACRVYKKRIQPQRQTLDWAKALKMGTSFSSSMWSAEQSATLRMWIGSSWTFWQQNPTVKPGQQHHCCPQHHLGVSAAASCPPWCPPHRRWWPVPR